MGKRVGDLPGGADDIDVHGPPVRSGAARRQRDKKRDSQPGSHEVRGSKGGVGATFNPRPALRKRQTEKAPRERGLSIVARGKPETGSVHILGGEVLALDRAKRIVADRRLGALAQFRRMLLGCGSGCDQMDFVRYPHRRA